MKRYMCEWQNWEIKQSYKKKCSANECYNKKLTSKCELTIYKC